jgi:phosphoribosylanthranilate isomerase
VRERVPCSIKAFVAGDRTIARFPEFGADFLMIDGPSPGSGEVFDWRLGEGVADPFHLIVSGGLNPVNVTQVISRLQPFGVDVATGVESSPGRKDPQKLREFVVNARRAAREVVTGHVVADGTADDRSGVGQEDQGRLYDWMDG